MWYDTRIKDLLGISYPILQGPFGGGMSSVELVTTVSLAGGMGGFGAYGLSAAQIAEVASSIRKVTSKPFNLNLWVSDVDAGTDSLSDEQFQAAAAVFQPYFDELEIQMPAKPGPSISMFSNQVDAILDLRPALFSFVFGIPSADILQQCRTKGIKTAGTATTLDEALMLESAGVDIIIASGFEAGGHRPSFIQDAESSMTGTFVLVQLIKEKTSVPVVAAGGIASGKGISAALTLGAEGVQVGTAFLACDESGATSIHKKMLFSEAAKYTMLSRAFTGRLGRGIANTVTKRSSGDENAVLPFPLQGAFLSALKNAALDKQMLDVLFFWSGQIAPILKHRKASKLMHSLVEETTEIMSQDFIR
jgi:nitronate monooxygenase